MIKKWKNEREFKIRLLRAISAIRVIEARIGYIEERMSQSIEDAYNKLIKLQERNESSAASLLAAEIAEKKKVYESILSFKLGLEKLRLRLESIRDVGYSLTLMKGLEKIIKDIKKNVALNLPELSILYTELEEKLNELDIETQIPDSEGIPLDIKEITDDEVKSILKEASEIASLKEKNKLPSPPGG